MTTRPQQRAEAPATNTKWKSSAESDTIVRMNTTCKQSTGWMPRLALVGAMVSVGLWSGPAFAEEGPQRWEQAIQQFEKQDEMQAPPENAVLFVGSSSIRLWNLPAFFSDAKVINRGFGGSEIADTLHYADRIVVKYKPRVIVFYAGDNDIAKKKTAEQVFDDFRRFAELVQKELPETKLVYIAIKPSVKRWEMWPTQKTANEKIRDYCQQHKNLAFADITTPMLGEDGKPRPELFVQDGLHLSEAGYKVWTKVITPLIAE